MKIIERILVLLYVFFSIIFIVLLLWKMLGDSPTELQILYGGFILIVSYLMTMTFKAGIFIGRVNEFMVTTKRFMSKTQRFMDSTNMFRDKTERFMDKTEKFMDKTERFMSSTNKKLKKIN